MRERGRFLRSFLSHPRQVGAVLPTSRSAVRDLLDMADLSRAPLVVELGAGTGVYTREILNRIPADARLLAFEVDGDLARLLSESFDDPRLSIINASAEHIEEHLGGEKADFIVSGLPFTSLPRETKGGILREVSSVLSPEGAFLVLQYSPLVRRDLSKLFPEIGFKFSPVNVPPAFLFRCSKNGGR